MAKKIKAAEEEEPEVDPAEAKRQRKAAKRAAAEAAAAAEAEEDDAAAKKARKAAKRKAKEAAAMAEEVEVDPAEAKRARKAAKRAAAEAAAAEEAEEVDPAEAKRARKAAKRAAAEAAEAADAATEDAIAEAKRKRKEAKKKEAEAAAGGGEDEEEVAKRVAKSAAGVGESDENLTVFVRGLPFSCEAETLRKDFDECGEIVNFNMPVNEEGRCKGIAFVEYSNKAGVEAALEFDGTDYGGRYLEVKIATPKGEKGKGKGEKGGGKGDKGKGANVANSDFAVFCGGLPYTVGEEQVRAHFADCGEIASVRMPKYEDGTYKGMAFVRFTCDEHVEAAIKLDGSDVEGRSVTVRRATDTPRKGDGKGKDKDGKDKGKGKGKDGKGKGKDGKGKKGKKGEVSTQQRASRDGAIVESKGSVKTFDDSDDE